MKGKHSKFASPVGTEPLTLGFYFQLYLLNCARHDIEKQKYMFSKCLLRHDVVRVFVSSLVLVFVRAILSWCP